MNSHPNGYTHKITYLKNHPSLDTKVPDFFRTTEDMVEKHVKTLQSNPTISDIKVEKL